MQSEQLENQQEFIEKMGLIVQRDGLPRIAGKILGLLIIQGGAFSFSELSERLQISRASVSTNTRLLESLSVVERTTKFGERQDYFQLKQQPYKALINAVQNNMRNAMETVNQTIAVVDDKDAQQRLLELHDFYDSFLSATKPLLQDK